MIKKQSASLDDLLKQAKTTNRLLAAQLKQSLTQQDLVKLLRGTDLTQPEIADVLDTTTATVSMTIARLKRKDGAKAKGVGSGADQNGDNGEQVNG